MIPVAIVILALSVIVNLILFRLYTRRYRDEIDNLTCELDRRNVYIAELQRRLERRQPPRLLAKTCPKFGDYEFWQGDVMLSRSRVWWN